MNVLISVKGENKPLGPITCCMLAVNKNVFRKYNIDAIIKSKSNKYLNEIGGKKSLLQHYFIKKIDAKNIKNIKDDVNRLILGNLNSIKNFWEHEVYVDTNQELELSNHAWSDEISHLIEITKIYKGKDKFNNDMYKLLDYTHSQYYDTEIKWIKEVYGNEDSIHTRKI